MCYYDNTNYIWNRPHLLTLWFNNVICTIFYFNVFYCNLKEKDHIRRIISSTKSKCLYEKSVLLLLFWFAKNFGSVGPIQKIKLPSPNDDISTFDQLIAMDKSFCIHHQNIKRLLTEIYKALHNISGNSLKELFVRRESTISLLSKPKLVIPSVNFVSKVKTPSYVLVP